MYFCERDRERDLFVLARGGFLNVLNVFFYRGVPVLEWTDRGMYSASARVRQSGQAFPQEGRGRGHTVDSMAFIEGFSCTISPPAKSVLPWILMECVDHPKRFSEHGAEDVGP